MKKEDLEKLCSNFVTIANKVEKSHCKTEWKFIYREWEFRDDGWCLAIDQGGFVEVFIDLSEEVVKVNDNTVRSIAEVESFLFRKLVEQSSNISDY